MLYGYDTNTNVCPSMHVTGSYAVYFSAKHSKLFGKRPIKIAFYITTLIICASTVFLKQHSIIDVFAGIIVSYICYPIVFKKEKQTEQAERKEVRYEKKALIS